MEFEITAEAQTSDGKPWRPGLERDWVYCRVWCRDFHEACEQGLKFAGSGRLLRIEPIAVDQEPRTI